jgi:CO/xanthine dehydrogenase Mo-binding subunit
MEVQEMPEFSVVGKSVPRVDAYEKVTGRAKFPIDLKLPGMLFAKLLRSPYPHARIVNIDTSKAKKHTGVKAIITGKDAPLKRIGPYIKDRYMIARDIVRYVGEVVVAVAATTIETAEEASELIKVDYEELPAIFDAEEALRKNPAVVIHPELFMYDRTPQPYPLYRFEPDLPNVYIHHKIRNGDTEKAFKDADIVVENRFSLPRVQHCGLEPHNATARPEPDGGLTIWVSTNLLYGHKQSLCQLLDIPSSKLRVISLYVGGAFGGRGGVAIPGIPGLLALKTGKPVKLVLSRDEVFIDGNPRQNTVVYIKDGAKLNGILLARELKIILNVGAYSGITPLITKNSSYGAVGTYRIPNFKFDSFGVATNEPPTGAFRGFGTPEVIWAIESNMDIIAEKLGIDPVEMRQKNILNEGEKDVCGMSTSSIGARQCLEDVREWIRWGNQMPVEKGPWKRGRGIALGNKYTLPGTNSEIHVKIHSDATIEVRTSAQEVGQGCNTILAQIAAEEFGTSINKVKIVFADTSITPFDMGTISSRITYHNGNALRLACKNAKQKLFEVVSKRMNVPVEDLELKKGVIIIRGKGRETNISDLFSPAGFPVEGGEILGIGSFRGPLEPEDPETGQGKRPVSYYAHGANAVEVLVNIETGETKVVKVASSFDMGQPINPKLCEGQMEGGVGMGVGITLYEQMVLENGNIINPNLTDYKLPSSADMPICENVKSMIAPAPHEEGPFGAKGFSEGALACVAPAIANAIFNATGVRIRDLPITREKMLKMLGVISKSGSKP